MIDIDDIFDQSRRPLENWRKTLTGPALELCEEIERRIEAGERPVWTKIRDGLAEHGKTISAGSIGAYYRSKYPHLRDNK